MISRTKIDWCDHVWNPVWGCRHNCPYCYARKLARRFGIEKAKQEKKHIESPGWTLELLSSLAGHLEAFQPTFLLSNFNKSFPRKPSRIFVDSMSDIAFWKPDWMHMVLKRIRRHPEHTFLFLTKDPRSYENLSFPSNCWLGVTITTQAEMDALGAYLFGCSWEKDANLFLSIEPILEPITLTIEPDWLILGAETGNRREKVVPELEWIQNLIFQDLVFPIPRSVGIPVFMKSSLQELWQMPLIQQFPAGMRPAGEAPGLEVEEVHI